MNVGVRVWESSLSATVLTALALLVLVSFGRWLPPWCRYGIWLLVLARLLMPVAPPAAFSVWNLERAREKPAPVMTGDFAAYEPAMQPPVGLRYEPRQRIKIVPWLWLLGTVGCFSVAVVRHARLRRWLRGQTVSSDPRVLSVLDRAKAAFGIRGRVEVICNDRFDVPAIFGGWRPRVLLPARWVGTATDQELFLVLLHELAHMKCRDGMLNWLCVAARSLHWFNPVAWYALRRLRKEREIFCDALVLSRINAADRTVYGSTLIHLAAQLSGAPPPASLVPILQHKPEIHRRIHMIAKYKPTFWMSSLGAALVIVALAGLTFTRAADRKPVEPAAAPKEKRAPASARQIMEEELAVQKARVREAQQAVDKLRERLQLVEDEDSPGQAEAIRKLEGRRIEASAELQRLKSLHRHLAGLGRNDLRHSITTAAPDAQLTELASNLDRAEQKLAELAETHTKDHPEAKRVTRLMAQINKQIDDRMDGILNGLNVRADAEAAHVEALARSLESARRDYVKGMVESRPYYEALQELRAQEEILQRLRLRAAQERLDRALKDSDATEEKTVR